MSWQAKAIHHIWVGSPIPEHLAANIQTWKDNHPEWSQHTWIDGELDWLENKDLYDQAERLVPPDAVGQFRADIARYEILKRYGGLYVDCDTVSLKPIDPYLEGHSAWAAYEDSHWVGNTYLAASPGHPVMWELVKEMRASIIRNAGNRPNKMTGPQFLTPIWKKHNCFVDRQELFFPYSYTDVKRGTVPEDLGEAVASHQWEHTKVVLDRRAIRNAATRARRYRRRA